ncbi:hypothetical protein CcaverHIS641_0602870 [Cutaneotrichosporon cavernicola]|nr:hypothetical protein CcaverHIS641_0602870 [Cutaneotrichosporon cavernicola]
MTYLDPLVGLGPDIFGEVLALLDLCDILAAELVSNAWRACAAENESRLWRGLAYAVGTERADLYAADALVATGTYPLPEYDMRPIATDMNQLAPGDRVNWRYVVSSHYRHLASWARARSTVEWVAPYPNIAWRIKSDAESGVVLSTSRMSGPLNDDIEAPGLLVVDRRTSRALWSIPELQGYSHLEAGAGYFAFNRTREDAAFEVWRNAAARARCTFPKQGVSHFMGKSHTEEEYDPADPSSPLPRGHYEHYLTLRPPKPGRAYRMHVDREGTKNAAPVLATCATTAIYIWHLEEDIEMETIERGADDQGSPNLDDDYVFVCDDRQMHVYVRETRAHIVSFPPLRAPPRNIASLGFPLSITDDFKAIPDADRLPGAAPVGRALSRGVLPTEAAFDDVIERSIAMIPDEHRENVMYGFSACHFTSRDFICTTEGGGVLIVRNYASVFAQCTRMEELVPAELEPPLLDDPQRHVAAAERAKHVANNSIIIGLGTTAKQLTTYRDHIVVATSFNVLLIDGRKIPDIPGTSESSKATQENAEGDKHDTVVSEIDTESDKVARRSARLPVWLDVTEDDVDMTGGDERDMMDDEEADDDESDDDMTFEIVPAGGHQGDEGGRGDGRDANLNKEAGPPPKADALTLPAHVLLGNHQQSMKLSSCLQADARSIYLTYWAAGEFPGGAVTAPTAAARDGLGLCIKAWTFGAL